MIDYQEYIAAGFSEAQAALLIARDQRYTTSVESLRDDVQGGFARTLAAIVAGFSAMDKRFDRIEQNLKRSEN